MRIIVVGDIHGRNIWKDIVNKEKGLFIFLGDYFDSFDIPLEEQIGNFQDILEFSKNNDCILLAGNHDYHYLVPGESFSGFQFSGYATINWLLTTANLRIVARYKDFLFSHAGITNTWLKGRDLEDVNDFNLKEFRFNGRNVYGDDVTQGPLWVRPASLNKDGLNTMDSLSTVRPIQIVGHTQQDAIDLDGPNIFCDTLAVGEYLIIDDLGISVGKI